MSRDNSSQRRSGRRTGSPTLFQQVITISDDLPVFTADRYVIDGGSGKTRSVVDHNDVTHVLDQANTTLQCALPAAHADFAGQLCLAPSGSHRYTSNRAASAWAFGNNGLGFTTWDTWTCTTDAKVLCATATAAGLAGGSTRGFGQVFLTTTTPIAFRVASGSAVVINQAPATVATINIPIYSECSYLEGAGPPEWVIRRKGTTIGSGDSAAAPSAGDPVAPLNLFTDSAGGFGFPGRWRESFFFDKVLSAGERATVQAYELQTNGLAA